MLAVFQRMTNSVFTHLGEDAVLRGNVPCRVNIQHGVQVIGHDDNVVVEKTVATIGSEHDPKVGDTLSHPDGNYKLDAPFRNNGFSRRFIVLKIV
jgi:hypothetical protein